MAGRGGSMSSDGPVPGGRDDTPFRRVPAIKWPIAIIVFLLGLTVVGVAGSKFVGVTATYTIKEACQGNNGEITVTAQSSRQPLTYAWSSPSDPSWTPPGLNVPTQTGLKPGTYEVVVSNGVAYVGTVKLTITITGLLDATLTPTTPTGFVTGDGVLKTDVTPPGEVCTFGWEDGSTAPDRSGLDAGIYSVKVTDATNAPCSLDLTHKLLPAYPTTCTEWSARNPRVLDREKWTKPAVGPPTPPFFHQAEVQSLLSLPGAFVGLKGCTGATHLTYTSTGAAPLLGYLKLHQSGPVVAQKWVYPAPAFNPAPGTLPLNHLAAELFTARLNLLSADLQPPSPAVRMADAIYLGHPYYGLTAG